MEEFAKSPQFDTKPTVIAEVHAESLNKEVFVEKALVLFQSLLNYISSHVAGALEPRRPDLDDFRPLIDQILGINLKKGPPASPRKGSAEREQDGVESESGGLKLVISEKKGEGSPDADRPAAPVQAVKKPIKRLSVADLFSLCRFLIGMVGDGEAKKGRNLKRLDLVVGEVLLNGELGFRCLRDYVFPCLYLLVVEQSHQFRLLAGEAIQKASEVLLGLTEREDYKEIYSEVLITLFPLVKFMLFDESSQVVKCAVETVVKMSQHMPQHDINNTILPFVLIMAHDKQIRLNTIAIKLMDKLAFKIGRECCINFINKEFQYLADRPFEVKKSLSKRFVNLCRCVGPKSCVKDLMPIFEELINSNDWLIRLNAIKSIVDLGKCVPPDYKEKLQTLFLQLFNDSFYSVKWEAAFNFGKFISHFCSKSLSIEIISTYSDLFTKQRSDQIASYALDFTLVVLALGKERWLELYAAYRAVARDKDKSVREICARMTSNIAKVIGRDQSEKYLLLPFKNFLLDETNVKIQAIKNFSQFLYTISPDSRLILMEIFMEAVSKNTEKSSWRIRYHAAQQVIPLTKLVDIKVVREKLVVFNQEISDDLVSDVRCEAAKNFSGLLHYFAVNGDNDYFDIVMKQINILLLTNTIIHRQLYIKTCSSALRMLPVEDFRRYFVKNLVALTEDKIVNVRITLALFLVKNKKFLVSLEELIEIYEKLKLDENPDIKNMLSNL